MDRLTKAYSDGTHGAADNLPCGENSYTYKGLLLEALGKYEDAEEQGLLLRLPCKAGSTVYKIITQRDNFDDRAYKIVSAIEFRVSMIEEIGKTVFLTQTEAEQKLKEMNSRGITE